MNPDGECDAAERDDHHRSASGQVDLVERSYSKRSGTGNSAAAAALAAVLPSNPAVCGTRSAKNTNGAM